jgi:hypothetical protein
LEVDKSAERISYFTNKKGRNNTGFISSSVGFEKEEQKPCYDLYRGWLKDNDYDHIISSH